MLVKLLILVLSVVIIDDSVEYAVINFIRKILSGNS